MADTQVVTNKLWKHERLTVCSRQAKVNKLDRQATPGGNLVFLTYM
jgi:hypothetical protein